MTALPPRIASTADVELVTRVLVDAFHDDSVWGAWAFPAEDSRRENRQAVFRAFAEGALPHRATWIAPGESAVAMWIPPGRTSLTTEQELHLEADLRRRLGPVGADRLLTCLDLYAATEPEDPHYYLSLLGTDPRCAGHGYGQRLLAHNLAVIDAEGAAAYLDCADDLVSLYGRFGFRVVGSVVPPGGPRSNGMWRVPRP